MPREYNAELPQSQPSAAVHRRRSAMTGALSASLPASPSVAILCSILVEHEPSDLTAAVKD